MLSPEHLPLLLLLSAALSLDTVPVPRGPLQPPISTTLRLTTMGAHVERAGPLLTSIASTTSTTSTTSTRLRPCMKQHQALEEARKTVAVEHDGKGDDTFAATRERGSAQRVDAGGALVTGGEEASGRLRAVL